MSDLPSLFDIRVLRSKVLVDTREVNSLADQSLEYPASPLPALVPAGLTFVPDCSRAGLIESCVTQGTDDLQLTWVSILSQRAVKHSVLPQLKYRVE